MALPNFLIIGAQKAGTTWLSAMLRQHPDVHMPARELHFFDKERNYARGLSWYEARFSGAAGEAAIGEKTPDYLWVERDGAEGHMAGAHERIAADLPDARLIAVLRDPVDRAVSAVRHLMRTGRASPLRSVDAYLVGSKAAALAPHGVLDKGFYHRQLSAYRERFAADRMLVLVFEEDVVRRPLAALRRACEFLGVDPSFEFDRVRQRVNAPRPSRPRLVLEHHLPVRRGAFGRLDRWFRPWHARPRAGTVERLAELYADASEALLADLARTLPWRAPGGATFGLPGVAAVEVAGLSPRDRRP